MKTYEQTPWCSLELRWTRTKKVTPSLIILAVILAILAPPAISQETLHVEDKYLDAYELDPIAVALGVTTEAEAAAFYTRQAAAMNGLPYTANEQPGLPVEIPGGNEFSDDVASDNADSTPQIMTTYTALESAVDELYDDLSRTPGARTIANQWRQCMRRDGFNYQSPVEIETDIDRRQTDNLPKLLKARDKCLAEVETATERLVLELLPEWKRDNANLLSTYSNALNLQTTR